MITTDGLEGSVLDTSIVTITWEGNEHVTEYSYILTSSNWSEWIADTSITLHYLDEGAQTFSVKGRYDSGKEDETPDSVNFFVDMVGEDGIRVYPLLTEFSITVDDSGGVILGSTQNIFIYAEEVENLVFFSFQVQYDPDTLSIDVQNISQGNLFSGSTSSSIFLHESISSGLIEVSFSALGSAGVSGTGSLAQLPFSANGEGSSTLQIINPQYGYIDGHVESAIQIVNGLVKVQ